MKTLSIKVFCLLAFGCLVLPAVYVGITYLIAWLSSSGGLAIMMVFALYFVSRFTAYAACAYLLKEAFDRYQLLKAAALAVVLVELLTFTEVLSVSLQPITNGVKLACSRSDYFKFSDLMPCIEQGYLLGVLAHLKLWLLPILCAGALVALSHGLKKRLQITL